MEPEAIHLAAAPILALCAEAEAAAATEDEAQGKHYAHEPAVSTANIRVAIAAASGADYFPAAILLPGDQAVSDDRLTLARFVVLTRDGLPTPVIGVARRDSTLDTWPALDFMAIEA